MDEAQKHLAHRDRVLTLLKALREVSKDLQANPIPIPIPFLYKTHSKAAIEAVLELETKALAVCSEDPNLHNLSRLLTTLRALIEKLDKYQGYGLSSLLHRQITNYKISQVACAIESQIQAYLDRVTVQDLVKTLLQEPANEEEQVRALIEFEERLAQGFDLDFQDLVLRAKVFTILERILCDPSGSKRVREQAAMAIAGLVKFNKNVFVGLVLMGPTVKALTAMASSCSIQVLSSLVRFIRSPLVDEILSHGEIPRIVSFLWSEDLSLRVAALDCVLELAYIGRREVIEAMLEQDLIKILMELQRSEFPLTEVDSGDESRSGVSVELETADSESNAETRERENVENFPFASCVSRFAIQLEVGEGLSPEEKREVKLEILRLVKEASQSDAEVASISAEILWGSSP